VWSLRVGGRCICRPLGVIVTYPMLVEIEGRFDHMYGLRGAGRAGGVRCAAARGVVMGYGFP
jgi:hypothetical protein